MNKARLNWEWVGSPSLDVNHQVLEVRVEDELRFVVELEPGITRYTATNEQLIEEKVTVDSRIKVVDLAGNESVPAQFDTLVINDLNVPVAPTPLSVDIAEVVDVEE